MQSWIEGGKRNSEKSVCAGGKPLKKRRREKGLPVNVGKQKELLQKKTFGSQGGGN